MVDCADAMQWTFESTGVIRHDDTCLSPGHTSLESGAVLTLESCTPAKIQTWSLASGYAYVQAAAFVTPANKTVLVVLNEHSEDVVFTLATDDGKAVETVVPKGGIRTYEW
ncbi:hypothetical protein ACHHYP_01622 [Achlya hypogyna]|uniref:Glycosyl hydrolase family 30 beta sandwich domain-containing protein n=1 Tax=Achlya hypogyna TaxID=1202772 RepID=A0A1V9Z8N4_ACHHY|nr:hypothetical protein ACHHYP_01622 [Achlya hypogyna]